MSAVTEIAKKAFPIAVIAVFSGTYYCANFWPMAPTRLPQQNTPIQSDSPNRLQPYQSPIKNLPSQEPDPRSIQPRISQRDFHVRTAAGEFSEDSYDISSNGSELSIENSLDDFELTIPQLQLEAPKTTASEPTGTSAPITNSDRNIRPNLPTVGQPVPLGSGNGHMIANPFLGEHQPASNARQPVQDYQMSVTHPLADSKTELEIPLSTPVETSLLNSTVDSNDETVPRPFPTESAPSAPSLRSILEPESPPVQEQSRLTAHSAANQQQHQASVAGGNVLPLVPLQLSNAVANQIRSHLTYGNSLARRSATLLAKREFTKGLRIVAESSDNQMGSSAHLRALQEGFTALQEAADFDNTEGVFEFDMIRIADSHDTPIIRLGYFEPNTPSQARKAYLLFAQDRIVQAVNKHLISAQLLHALGKTHLVDAMYGTNPQRLDFARSAVLFQCALIVDPQHVRSANELGVILARSGRLADAKVLFQNAIRSDAEFSEGWNNLAKVHRQLGEDQYAELASFEAEQQLQDSATQTVRVVQQEEFNNLDGAWGLPSGEMTSVAFPEVNKSSGSNDLAQQPNRTMFSPGAEAAAPNPQRNSWFRPNAEANQQRPQQSDHQPKTFKTFGGF